MKNIRLLELTVGITFILCAIFFSIYMYKVASNLNITNTNYNIKAKFNNVGTLNVGSLVFIKGIRVGKVDYIYLNQTDYSVEVVISLSKDIKIPKGSLVSVESESFLGNNCLRIYPKSSSNDVDYIKDNQYITYSKDWQTIEDKIGNLLFK